MSEKYIPLYRKYRPKNLGEVVGQEHVKKALTNAISLNKITHAYLFTGPRGTGKTSIARILAKSLNCQEGPTVTPCEVCPSCLDIKNSTPMDVIEIDAASNRKVEDAQNILEKIQYVPVHGKYKIYIIDEVHMLSNHAFNALLKTLEEPPENVIFILATTEPHKVLETITSRCQRFDFRRITTQDIVDHLKEIAKIEKIKINEEALYTIAKSASGGMRDSLALLDQVSVLDNKKEITSEDVNKLLGRLSFDVLNTFSGYLLDSNAQSAIEFLEDIYNSGNEPSQILTNLMGYLKNLLIVKNCQGEELLIELTQLNSAQLKALATQSEKVDTHQITFLIEKIVYYIKELKTTTNQQLWLEVAIIDLANLAQNTSLMELQERLQRLENGTVSQVGVATTFVSRPVAAVEPKIVVTKSEVEHLETKSAINVPVDNQLKASSKEVIEEKSEVAKSVDIDSQVEAQEEMPPMPVSHTSVKDSGLSDLWLALLQNISSTPTVSLLNQHTVPIEISEEKVVIGCKENFLKLVSSDTKKKAIEEGAKKFFGKNVSVVIKAASASELTQTVEKKNPIVNVEKPAVQAKASSTSEEVKKKQVSSKPSEVDENEDFAEYELAKKANNSKKIATSDQVNMVMTLFDGKYID